MNAPRLGIDGQALTCANCRLRAQCMGPGRRASDPDGFDVLVAARLRLPRRAALYHAGDRFESIYAVRLGSLISAYVTADGREQVAAYHLAGEWLGLDGIATDRHTCDVVALEEVDICVIPYARLLEVAQTDAAMSDRLNRMMSREIVREQQALIAIGRLHALERIASFLRDLSERLAVAGRSPSDFVLPMKRDEIGSYLGLKLETVCRGLARLAAEGVIDLHHRHVRIRDCAALRALARSAPAMASSVGTGAIALRPVPDRRGHDGAQPGIRARTRPPPTRHAERAA